MPEGTRSECDLQQPEVPVGRPGHHLAGRDNWPCTLARTANTARYDGLARATERTPLEGTFAGIAQRTTTDVHVLHNGRSVYDGWINVEGQGNESLFSKSLALARGDTVDFAVGFGNGFYGGDTTALSARIQSPAGEVADAARDFSVADNPNGNWKYGVLAPGPQPEVATLKLYSLGRTLGGEPPIGSLSNPGSTEWEDVLADQHPYQRVPHTASVIHTLRTISGGRTRCLFRNTVLAAVSICGV